MNRTKLFLMLSLFAILMTVFGSAMAQEPGTPAFKVSEVVMDDHVVLVTKDFPAGVAYADDVAYPRRRARRTPTATSRSRVGVRRRGLDDLPHIRLVRPLRDSRSNRARQDARHDESGARRGVVQRRHDSRVRKRGGGGCLRRRLVHVAPRLDYLRDLPLLQQYAEGGEGYRLPVRYGQLNVVCHYGSPPFASIL